MGIYADEKNRIITLETERSSYQMKIDEYGFLLHTYYGKKISGRQDLSYLFDHSDRGFNGVPYELGDKRTHSLDTLPQEYGVYGAGDYRDSALKVRYADGSVSTKLKVAGYRIREGKYSIPGLPAVYADEKEAHTLEMDLEDAETGLKVTLYYGVIEGLDALTRTVRVTNGATTPVVLEKVMSGQVDYMEGRYDRIVFYGRHALERMVSRTPVSHGRQSVGSCRVQSGHFYNPAMILCDPKTTEDYGPAWGFLFAYSGDFSAETEMDGLNQTRVLMGIGSDNFRWKLMPGESFFAPEMMMVFSGEGLGAMSRSYQKLIAEHICRGKYRNTDRPVLINNWEGTYFDFTGEKLLKIARSAAELGVDLFVMDDGWFGKRDSDFTGLGDWIPNEKKLGCTLKELGDSINGMGMKFGIWFEPESVSEDSDLYRAHPDWAMKVPGKLPNLSRTQLVLDFSRQEVRDYIYGMLCRVLDSAPISYVKWDLNRSICDLYDLSLPADRQGEVAHRYVLGLYEMLEKLLERYPEILFEGCCGGGGRFDAGMLYYTPQIWCSDDTDPVERLKIQYGTSFFYPVSAMGAHVSASPNHQTGRKTPFHTRGVAAMSGTFGYELDVNRLSEEEKKEIREQISTFRELSPLLRFGDYYRLTDPFEDLLYTAWEMVSEDKKEAVVNVISTHSQPNAMPVYLHLKGLDPDRVYEMNGKKYTGSVLEEAGIRLEYPKEEYQAWQYVIRG